MYTNATAPSNTLRRNAVVGDCRKRKYMSKYSKPVKIAAWMTCVKTDSIVVYYYTGYFFHRRLAGDARMMLRATVYTIKIMNSNVNTIKIMLKIRENLQKKLSLSAGH